METAAVLGVAKQYALSFGWRVLPIVPGTKRPAQEDWPDRATTDPAVLETWWSNGSANGVGIVCGAASGLLVLDVDDNGSDKRGEDTLADLVAKYGPLPDTPTVHTPSGGRHLYFAWPGFNPIQGALGEWIDIRAEGHQNLAPPSVHPNGKEYVWDVELRPSRLPLAELPAAWLDLIRPATSRPNDVAEGDDRCGPILAVAGFARGRTDRKGQTHWTRPGKSPKEGASATVYPWPDHHCVIWSSSVAGVETGRPYGPNELRRALDVDEAAGTGAAGGGLTVVRSSTVRIKRQRWLWAHRLPLGGAALLVGQEGLGKSTVAIDAGAQATRGTLDGELVGTPVGVVYVSAEDAESSTIVPRLIAAGADLDRVFFVRVDGLVGGLVIPDHLTELAGAMREHDARLLVLDPFSAHLPGGSFDSHREHHVRRALAPLAQCMEELDATALGVMHWNKAPTLVALDRVLGSRAFTATARAILGVGQDPNDPDTRLLVLAKSNLGPLDVPALAFTIDQRLIPDPDGGLPIATSGVEWLGDREGVRTADLFRVADPDEGGALERAKALIDGVLSGGPVDAKELDIAQKVEGISTRTMRRARQDLGVIAEPVKDSTGKVTGWTVRLP